MDRRRRLSDGGYGERPFAAARSGDAAGHPRAGAARLAAVAIGLAWTVAASAQDAPLEPAAAKFLRRGPAHALAGCDLWRHRCGNLRLVVVDSNDGEANDVPRHAEGVTAPGMSLDVTFELPPKGSSRPPHPLIERLRVSTSRWPLPAPLRLGDAPGQLLRALGTPTLRLDACWRYTDAPDFVTFCFEHDRLASVQWEFFVD